MPKTIKAKSIGMPSREETLLSSTHKKITAETVSKKRAIRRKYNQKASFFQVRVSKYGARARIIRTCAVFDLLL